jgi:uncharacterized protein
LTPEHSPTDAQDQDRRDIQALGAQPCSGRGLKSAAEASARWLEAHIDLVNSLNVYPVPDGDTGTNMHLTVQAALAEMSEVESDSAGMLGQALAHGALMGARGNSGVILSQILRGIARALDSKETFNAMDFALALKEGAATAYKGVLRPVEGTILTVIREAAEVAVAAAGQDGATMQSVLQMATNEAERSLARTPSLLAVLREAGVVDAGGQGLVFLLQGLLRFLRGETSGEIVTRSAAIAHATVPEEGYGYDVQFIMRGEKMDVEAIRGQIAAIAESVLVVGDEQTIKVHAHSEQPGQILDIGTAHATLLDVVVENMQVQHEAYLAKIKPATNGMGSEMATGIGIVAVVPGQGLQRVFESLGVNAVVAGGQTMNPSTEELLSAVNALPNERVIILPNNSNVVLTAQQAQGLASKEVAIVPTKTIPQGISALLALNYQADLQANATAMEEAARTVQTIEVTTAVRSAKVNGFQVAQGEIIALLNGELAAVGQDGLEAAEIILQQIHAERMEIITIYFGGNTGKPEADAFAASIKERFPAQDIELIDGGQPHYQYILSVE